MRHRYTLIFTVLTSALIAQSPYRPFPEGNAAWVEYHDWLEANIPSDDFIGCTRTIEFGTDTVLGDSTYHRLRSRGAGTGTQTFPPNNSWPVVEPSHTLCFFRQDVAARQVFVYDTLAQQEVLWYDFNLGLGDYPQTWDQPFDDGYVQVVALDSMLLNDGWHRTWGLGLVGMSMAYCTIVEGVGSTYGLNTTQGLLPPFEQGDQLTCHSRESLPVYPLGAAECDLSVGLAAGAPAPARMRIFPNPATDRVQVFGANAADSRYALMDLMGNAVQHGLLTGSIDIRPLVPGVYVLRITDTHGERCAMRVVKN